jgi:hypothetical protein
MKNQTMSILRSLLLLVAIFLFSQCNTEDPEPENEEELITTLEMTFSPVGGGDDVVFSVFDEDGDGPTEPVYTNGTLAADTDYNVSIEVRNDEGGENITTEIEEEDEEHQFFFQKSNGLNIEFAYNDADGNGDPIGLSTVFTTKEASSGSLVVILRHEPNKSAEGAQNGDPSNAGGETDIQATFDVVIEPRNEKELITTLEMTFSPVSGGDDLVFSVYDADGDGPIEPEYINSSLAADTDYNVSIEVRNDEEGEDITVEIAEEDDEHQFFFQISNGLNIEFAYNDVDENSDPIGLSTIFSTGVASSGSLVVILRHEPDKSASGVANGDPSNAGGETDIQATFEVVIE